MDSWAVVAVIAGGSVREDVSMFNIRQLPNAACTGFGRADVLMDLILEAF